MLPIFLGILIFIGAALMFRGRALRGLLVLSLAAATEAGFFAAESRWGWLALAFAGLAACGVAMVMVER